MSLIKSFKQAPRSGLTLTVALVAAGGVAVLAVRQNQMQKEMKELQKVATLNAAVTLNLTNALGQMTRSEIQ